MRLFVAILLNEEARSALVRLQSGLARACPDVRWVAPEQLHLTVQFLGDVRDLDVPRVAGALQRAARVDPFDMELGGAGCFPDRGQVRIVWAGARDPTGRLVQCVESVSAELEAAGFPRERRPWSAHLTVGRVREDRSYGAIRSAVEAARFGPLTQSVAAVSLMSSVLSPKGATYSVVSTASLGRSGTFNHSSR